MADVDKEGHSSWPAVLIEGLKAGLLAMRFNQVPHRMGMDDPDTNSKRPDGYLRLYDAWLEGDYEYIDGQLAGARLYALESWDGSPENPLQFAMRKGDDELVKLVLERGYDLDHTGVGAHHWTILHWACHLPSSDGRRASDYVPLLLKRGADATGSPNARFPERETPLHFACKNLRVRAVHSLCGVGADVNARDHHHRTPLFYLAEAGDSESALDIVDLLVKYGADVNSHDDLGQTALFDLAANQGELAVRYLVELGADINARNDKGETPLFYCQWSHHTHIALVCLELGANPMIENEDGQRAFDRSDALRAMLLREEFITESDLREA